MSTLAVIYTVYRRPWAYDRVNEALRAQTRAPDIVQVMSEPIGDGQAYDIDAPGLYNGWRLGIVRPGDDNPLSVAINNALEWLDEVDYITYLTDDSLPDPRKYEVMSRALDEHPEWGVVYCGQDFGTAKDPEDWLDGGRQIGTRHADRIVEDPWCVVDHTQVMHRRTSARWPQDRSTMRLSDAHFWRELVADLGPFYPVPEVLDWTRQLPDGISSRA